jgi:hypothetical protein
MRAMRRSRGGFERRTNADGQAVKPARDQRCTAKGGTPSRPCEAGPLPRRQEPPNAEADSLAGDCRACTAAWRTAARFRGQRHFADHRPHRDGRISAGHAGARRPKRRNARPTKTAAIRQSSPLFEIRVDSSSNFALHEAIERRMSAANAAGRPLAPTCRSVALPGPAGQESHDTAPWVSLHGTPARTSLRFHPGHAHCLSTVVRRW